MKKFSFVTLLLLVTMVVTAILPSGSVLAADRGVTFSMYTPSGVILDRTPEFTWKRLSGISYYEIKVVQYSTVVYDKVYDTCTTTYCSVTPSFTLGYKDYNWYVRAQGGTWSTPMAFVVSSPEFYSGFNGSYAGWSRFKNVGASWSVTPSYLWTYGSSGNWSPFYRNANGGKYNDFDLSVRVRRYYGTSGSSYPANCVMARMGAYVGSTYLWYPGYRFCISTNGKYEIYYKGMSSTENQSIQPWTYSSKILAGNGAWNTLRVRAVGTSFWFYINGNMVKSFSDASKDRGYVGVMMYKFPSASTEFDVDWAQLYVVESSAASDKAVLEKAVLTPISEEDVIGTK